MSNTTDFSLAFTNNLQMYDTTGIALRIRVLHAGDLLVSSGRVVAYDPYWLNSAPQAYTVRVPQGSYPVFVSVAQFEPHGSQQIACAKLQFSERPVTRWEMAVVPGQDVNLLKPHEHFCYGVDAGTGCFVDYDVVEWLFEQAGVRDLAQWRSLPYSRDETLISSVYDYFDQVVDTQLEVCFLDVHTHASVILNNVTGGNLILFPSGWGDGCYSSYFGYAANDSVVCLVTDFGVLIGAR